MTVASMRRGLTLTELGVIFSIAVSALTGAFTFGVLVGQVNTTEQRVNRIEPIVMDSSRRIERIDANVEFLTELAREERSKR